MTSLVLLNELLEGTKAKTFPLFKIFYIKGLTNVNFMLDKEPPTVSQADAAAVSHGLKDIHSGKRTPAEAHKDVADYMLKIPSASKRVPMYQTRGSMKVTKNVLSLLLIADPLLWHVTHENTEVKNLINDYLGTSFEDRDPVGLQHALIDANLAEYAEGDL